MITHLKTINVPVNRFTLGVNPTVATYLTWKTFLDSWKMVDKGKSINELPLYHALTRYYGERPEERRIFEAQLLNINSIEGKDIANGWINKHIELYQSIKKNGFDPSKREKPITVNIKDNGALHLLDGNHTVSILKHLKYRKKVNAVVEDRSKGWVKLKNRLYGFYGKKMLYQPTGHPDLDDWQIDRECMDRWNIIKKTVAFKGKTVLDVGSCTGWFSLHATAEGAKTIGIDPNRTRIDASQLFASFHGFPKSNPVFVEASFEKYLGTYKTPKFDIALVLSLLHHYIRRNPDEAWRAVTLISQRCQSMVLELGLNDLPIKWHPKLILNNSNYTKYKTLYEGERPIYLFTV